MSWIERLENIQFTITTGDGNVFEPLWKNGEKSKEYNISKYEFINLSGSLIERREPQGNVYPLIFWFQGEDNIEKSDEFEVSANDNRFWTIEHPFYGTIKGQPTNLKRNDKSYNVTEITVTFWESIDGNFPDNQVSLVDEVRSKSLLVDNASTSFFLENAPITFSEIDSVKNNVNISGSVFNPDASKFNEFSNLVSVAVSSADNIILSPRESFLNIQRIITFPATFEKSVKSRISEYTSAYNNYKSVIDNVFSKFDFESTAASIISGICVSCINPIDTDYITRSDIEEVNDLLLTLYEDYLTTIDENQVDIYDIDNAWSPTIQIQSLLSDLVSFTSRALFSLSFNARQERTLELTEDTNLIVLTHRLVGLDENDENINIFRQINNIRNNELLKIEEGRTIKYFV